MPKILIQEGGQQSVFELFDDEITIGRGAANAIQVADGHASKHHAVIRRLGGRVKLVDLESKNGTRVNGEFKNQRWLAHGDVVAIGAMTMTFDGSDVAAAPVPVAAAYAAPAVVSGPALSVMAAPAAPPPMPAAPRAAPRPSSSRRARDDGDEREERPRGVPRRSNNNAVVAMMVGAGVIGLIVILILLIGGGAGKNALALRSAKQLYQRDQDPAAAAAYLRSQADPSDVDGYVSVAEKLKEWDSMAANAGNDALVDEAKAVMKKLIRDRVEQHMNGLSDEALGRRALEFAEKYKDTPTAMELLNSPYGDNPKLRALMEKAKAAK
ncbi:MAG: FHA domain-containing protein [Planctomycetota bacterium]